MNKNIFELAKESELIQYESDGKTEAAVKFAEMVIDKCIDLVHNIKRHDAITTYDLNLVESTIQRCSKSLEDWKDEITFKSPKQLSLF